MTHLLLPSSETTLYELNAPRPNLNGATVLGLATYLGELPCAVLSSSRTGLTLVSISRAGKQEVVERLLSNAGRFRGFVAVDGRDAKSGTALMCEPLRARRRRWRRCTTLTSPAPAPDAARDGHPAITSLLVRNS